MTSIIREAQLPNEVSMLEDFLNQHWFDAATPSAQTYRSKLLTAHNTHPLLLCLEKEGSVRGLLQANQSGRGHSHLHRIVVDSEYRHRGIATELLIEFTEQLDNQGLSSDLLVHREKPGLQRLYQNFGYAIADADSFLHTPSHIHMERASILEPTDFS